MQIEAEVKGISHKKLISKSDLFESMLLVSNGRLKAKNARLGVESQVQMDFLHRYQCQMIQPSIE